MPLDVILAEPSTSNTVRVTFSEKPRAFTELGPTDALLRDNWTLSVVTGTGTAPVVEKVENLEAREEVAAGAWSVDLRTDRRLLLATTYLVVAGAAIESDDGLSTVSAPPDDRWEFPGIAEPRPKRDAQPASTTPGVDFRYDAFTGRFRLDPTTDYDVSAGLESLKKRVLRRLQTAPGGFFHLPTYGAGLRVKGKVNAQQLDRLRRSVKAQVLAEVDVEAAEVGVARLAPGVILVTVRARTVSGPGFELGLEVPADGPIVLR